MFARDLKERLIYWAPLFLLMRLLSWNVNGLRAVHKKGFLEWLRKEQPEVLAVQEIKAYEEQLPSPLLEIEGYKALYYPAERKGYSGVALYTKVPFLDYRRGMGIQRFDCEGRLQRVDFGSFVLFNGYFPNGNMSPERLQYKLDFYEAFLTHALKLVSSGRKVIFCGDLNTAHKEIDLARPKSNEGHSGFLPIERAWIDRVIERGFSDTLRLFQKGPGLYSYWDMKTRARDRNVGWRLDYFFASKNAVPMVKDAFILSNVQGSDHCPVGITFQP
jgi:exodeoxyribonuclease III